MDKDSGKSTEIKLFTTISHMYFRIPKRELTSCNKLYDS